MAVAVDVRVHGNVASDEGDFRRVKRILGAELKLELELLAFVQGALHTFHVYDPAGTEASVSLFF